MEGKFEINLDKNNLGIIGSSMGGLALNTIIEYPDEFGLYGHSLSGYFDSRLSLGHLLLQSGKELVGRSGHDYAIYET